MVSFRGHGTVPTPCSVPRIARNEMVPFSVRLGADGTEWHLFGSAHLFHVHGEHTSHFLASDQ
jgi:hypothetical protein